MIYFFVYLNKFVTLLKTLFLIFKLAFNVNPKKFDLNSIHFFE